MLSKRSSGERVQNTQAMERGKAGDLVVGFLGEQHLSIYLKAIA
jgi:hypothetical protein